MVTLYHWDLPQTLQDLGGWANEIVVDAFADFSRICFESFGDHVRHWITINEPFQVCHPGYGNGELAPGVYSPGIGEYLCAHNLIKGHARVWRMYDDHFRHSQKGKFHTKKYTRSVKEIIEHFKLLGNGASYWREVGSTA